MLNAEWIEDNDLLWIQALKRSSGKEKDTINIGARTPPAEAC